MIRTATALMHATGQHAVRRADRNMGEIRDDGGT
jgi:hypothetical protein